MVRGESVFWDVSKGDFQKAGFDQIEGEDATGDFYVQLTEETDRLFHILGEGELRQITELKLAEYTNNEIAEKMGCHVRTVKRRLQTIRSILASFIQDDD